MGDFSPFLGAEWTYLLKDRKVAGDDSAFTFVRLQYGSNPTDTVTGMVIYPDDFSFADAGVGAMRFGTYQHAIDIDTWEALEEAGCIFLPSSSSMDFSTSTHEWTMWGTDDGRVGIYHAATAQDAGRMQRTIFFCYNNGLLYTGDRNPVVKRQRLFVRLAQDY